MFTSPKVTEEIVQQCVDLGIKHAWMHCLMGTKPGLSAGTTSVSQSARQMGSRGFPARAAGVGITVVRLLIVNHFA